MGNLKGKDLKKIGYTSNQAISVALSIVAKHNKYASKEEKVRLLQLIKEQPENYKNHPEYGAIASHFLEKVAEGNTIMELKEDPSPFAVFGRDLIDSNAWNQMNMAMRLPIAKGGALMPDAHQGFGMPIGGVLASENSVIPYAVGLDIGCRMCLTIYDVGAEYLKRNQYQFKQALKSRTNFGVGGTLPFAQEHAVLEDDRFGYSSILRSLRGKAIRQLGTSGSGNHFVEFGLATIKKDGGLNMQEGEYLALLSHSGSRGLGAGIGTFYSDLAQNRIKLPKQVQALAWLDLDSEAGAEYWMSMELAGAYAEACHESIEKNLSKFLGLKSILQIDHHHNFAWKERQKDGQEWIVHRKGATPASKGTLGVIPGDMVSGGRIVRGLGFEYSINSASHGAGRKWSRGKAKASFTGSALKKLLSQNGVQLIGGGVEEAPAAYKEIDQVMSYQRNLVEVIGHFTPKIVRMDKG